MTDSPDQPPKKTKKRKLKTAKEIAASDAASLPTLVGWQEWALLPSLATTPIRAKIDTGAASSSVHASQVVIAHDPFGRKVASFELHLDEDRASTVSIHNHRLKDTRVVRSSSGHWSSRPVITLPIQLGAHVFEVDVTLASRDPMEYRMLIGRSALRKRFFVDTNQSFLLGEPE